MTAAVLEYLARSQNRSASTASPCLDGRAAPDPRAHRPQRVRSAPARHELQIPVHQPVTQAVTHLARPRLEAHKTRKVGRSDPRSAIRASAPDPAFLPRPKTGRCRPPARSATHSATPAARPGIDAARQTKTCVDRSNHSYRRVGARGLPGLTVTRGAHISHSGAKPIPADLTKVGVPFLSGLRAGWRWLKACRPGRSGVTAIAARAPPPWSRMQDSARSGRLILLDPCPETGGHLIPRRCSPAGRARPGPWPASAPPAAGGWPGTRPRSPP
jgi:hypothetical protein